MRFDIPKAVVVSLQKVYALTLNEYHEDPW